jgi:hypothetical protein
LISRTPYSKKSSAPPGEGQASAQIADLNALCVAALCVAAGDRASGRVFRAGRLPVDQLLTHRLKLEEIDESFDGCAREPGFAGSSY